MLNTPINAIIKAYGWAALLAASGGAFYIAKTQLYKDRKAAIDKGEMFPKPKACELGKESHQRFNTYILACNKGRT